MCTLCQTSNLSLQLKVCIETCSSLFLGQIQENTPELEKYSSWAAQQRDFEWDDQWENSPPLLTAKVGS